MQMKNDISNGFRHFTYFKENIFWWKFNNLEIAMRAEKCNTSSGATYDEASLKSLTLFIFMCKCL